jgi:hypothetical protein
MEPRNRFRQLGWPVRQIGLSYWPARLGIDSWSPLKVYKYGLRFPSVSEKEFVNAVLGRGAMVYASSFWLSEEYWLLCEFKGMQA